MQATNYPEVSIKKPGECTAEELQGFVAFVLAGGEVMTAELNERVRKAEFLVFLSQDGCLKGIAAVKKPAPGHRIRVFQKAHASRQDTAFPFELGWVFVLPSSRGAGFSHKLVNASLSTISGQGIFATSRTDNRAMHRVLKAHGLFSVGQPFTSSQGDHQLILFASRTAAESGASVDAP